MTSQHDKPKRWQFGVRDLLVATGICACLVAIMLLHGWQIVWVFLASAFLLGLLLVCGEWRSAAWAVIPTVFLILRFFTETCVLQAYLP